MGPLFTDDNTVTSSKPVQHQTPHTRPGSPDTRAASFGATCLFGSFLVLVLVLRKLHTAERKQSQQGGWQPAPPMSRKAMVAGSCKPLHLPAGRESLVVPA